MILIFPFFCCLSLGLGDFKVQLSESEDLKGEDYPPSFFQPRQSIQWPRPASGYVRKSDDWVCLSKKIDATYKVKPTGLDATVLKQALDDLRTSLTDKEDDCLKATSDATPTKDAITTMQVDVATAAVPLGPGIDESYKLTIEGNKIAISAQSVWGARHAITTLTNMLEIRNFKVESAALNGVNIASSDMSHHHILPYTSFEMNDKPRLEHRGVMIDTSRSYQSISTIKRTIKTMAQTKLNVLHIHATDDQSFPLLMSKSAPLIHGADCTADGPVNGGLCHGAFSNHHIYTQTQMKDIITTAKTYGIRVLIEIDQPAHARSWASVTKELRECDALEHQTDEYCAEPICGPLALDKNWDGVVALAHTIADDWLALQEDPYMHYGMDEIKPGCWGELRTDELRMKYLDDALQYLKSKDASRRMVVWQDGITVTNAPLPDSAGSPDSGLIVQVWNDPLVGGNFLSAGRDVIWSNYDSMYLDCGRGNPAVANYTSWCTPYKTWWSIYKETPDITLASSLNTGRVLGGEVALWAEQANDEVFDSLLWPRAAAWAGAAWEARSSAVGDPMSDAEIESLHDVESELRKFANMIIAQGVAATAMYTDFCVFEDKTLCDRFSRSYLGPDGPVLTTTPPPGCGAVHNIIGSAFSGLVLLILVSS